MDRNAEVGLADAIASLRKDLEAAQDEGRNAPMKFRLAPIDLSLQIAIKKEAEGKIGWQVIGLGGSVAKEATQTLTLRLEPVWQQEDGSYTDDFTISGQSSRSPHLGPRESAHTHGPSPVGPQKDEDDGNEKQEVHQG